MTTRVAGKLQSALTLQKAVSPLVPIPGKSVFHLVVSRLHVPPNVLLRLVAGQLEGRLDAFLAGDFAKLRVPE